jgi:hypothetical protein
MELASKSGWIVVASLYDIYTAHSLAALLNAELVPAEVGEGSRGIGEARLWEVRVPSPAAERTQLLLAPSVLSDAELGYLYLATGTLPGTDATH